MSPNSSLGGPVETAPGTNLAVPRAERTETGATTANPPVGGPEESAPGTSLAVPLAERGQTGAVPSIVNLPDVPPRDDPTKLLMKSLGIEDSPIRLYGWIQNSYTGNTNGTPRNGVNFGVYPNHLANRWQGNQYYFIVENPNEPNDEVNLGFRVDTLFGNDWLFTKDYGLFDHAFPLNHFAGVDLPQLYGSIHLPYLTRGGIDIKGGRWYSPCGYEGVQAVRRPLLSVPYALNFTPFTFFGVLATVHLTDQTNFLTGSVNGWDRWINPNFKWSYIGGLTWTSKDGKTSFNTVHVIGPDQLPRFAPANSNLVPTGVTPPPFLAGRRNLGYGGDNRLYFSTTLTRQWTNRFIEAIQTDQVLDQNTPGFGPGGSSHNTEWYDLVHWFLYVFNEKTMGVWRAEAFRDNNGAATGVADTFYEMTLGVKYTPKPWLWIRPEARYDWARSTHPFNDGTRASQLTLAVDVRVLF